MEVIVMRISEQQTARIGQYIEMCDFPCSKEELLLEAEDCEFPDDVMDVVEELPNRRYDSPEDAMKAIGDSRIDNEYT